MDPKAWSLFARPNPVAPEARELSSEEVLFESFPSVGYGSRGVCLMVFHLSRKRKSDLPLTSSAVNKSPVTTEM